MSAVREAWTDERLDDLKDGMHHEFVQVRTEMSREFDQVHRESDQLRADMDRRFDGVDQQFKEVRADIKETNMRFDPLQRTILVGNFSIIATLIGLFIAKGLL